MAWVGRNAAVHRQRKERRTWKGPVLRQWSADPEGLRGLRVGRAVIALPPLSDTHYRGLETEGREGE